MCALRWLPNLELALPTSPEFAHITSKSSWCKTRQRRVFLVSQTPVPTILTEPTKRERSPYADVPQKIPVQKYSLQDLRTASEALCNVCRTLITRKPALVTDLEQSSTSDIEGVSTSHIPVSSSSRTYLFNTCHISSSRAKHGQGGSS